MAKQKLAYVDEKGQLMEAQGFKKFWLKYGINILGPITIFILVLIIINEVLALIAIRGNTPLTGLRKWIVKK